VICPKCGEDNSDNFRFCGMCGTLLEARVEARRPAGAPVLNLPLPNPSKTGSAPEPPRPPVSQNASNTASQQLPSIGGTSMLGLDQPGAYQPSVDSLREKSFSGLDSFFEPEQPKTGGRRVLLLVVLLAALGGAGWWTYTNYLDATENRRPEVATSTVAQAPVEKPSPQPATKATAPALDSDSPPAATPLAAAPEVPSENANPNAAPDAEAKSDPDPKPLTPSPAPVARALKIAPPDKAPVKREPHVISAEVSKSPPPAAADKGAEDFRKADAYLYGRGASENCDEAVKYLKAASAKSNAKARSTFGTMYATGHCVPRDLPTSYLWFALALRADPNNQILEKDLNAVWNQMTPPERQQATRMKQ